MEEGTNWDQRQIIMSSNRALTLGVELPCLIEAAVKYERDKEIVIEGKRMAVAKEKWPTEAFGEYD